MSHKPLCGPQAVVRREVAVGGTQAVQPIAKQSEVKGFVGGHFDPA